MSFPIINKVTVIGGGTMGSGIAAHLANLGFSVSLLSLTREEAIAGLERVCKTNPTGFMTNQAMQSIKTGSIQANPELIEEADWVCEAIVEKLGPKQSLYMQLEELAKNAALISTNTSGLPLADLAAGRSEEFRARFLGTHFFNPPRYLKLLELIPAPDSSPNFVKEVAEFLETSVARRVIVAKDTPGFIANRFGMFVLYQSMHLTEQLRFTLEQVDAVTGLFLGRPRSGTFRLADIIGLDVMNDIAVSLRERCVDEASQSVLTSPVSFAHLLEKGWIGDKAGHGYYRREGPKEVFTYDLITNAYRSRQEPNWDSLTRLSSLELVPRLKEALTLRDELGEFVRGHLPPILSYAESIRAEVSHSALDFDRVMQWGFGWEMGPFQLADELGHEAFNLPSEPYYSVAKDKPLTLASSGKHIHLPSEPEYVQFSHFPIVDKMEAVTIRDLGDGTLALSLTTKQGSISPQVVSDLTTILNKEPGKSYILTSDSKNFSVGYDLRYFLEKIEQKAFEEIDSELAKLHRLGELLEKHKVVAAVHGYVLGAGLELALSCPLIVADSESKMGLPESRVGLIPGGRGTVLSRLHASGTAKNLSESAANLVLGTTSKSALEGASYGFLRSQDKISFHPDRLASEAIKFAKTVTPLPRPDWQTPEGPVVGMIDRTYVDIQKSADWSPYDGTIAEKVKNVYTRATSYEDALLRERSEFIDLASKSLTQARIRHMLENGKPLRN